MTSTWTLYDDLLILDPRDEEHIRQLSLDLWAAVYRKEYEDYVRCLALDEERIWRIEDEDERLAEYRKWQGRKEDAPDTAHRRAADRAGRAAIKGITVCWSTIRKRVWQRDGPVCQVCETPVKWHGWECGHIVDRICGGSDRPTNLVVMCHLCNRLKPMHRTKEEYRDWLAAGAVLGSLMQALATAREEFLPWTTNNL